MGISPPEQSAETGFPGVSVNGFPPLAGTAFGKTVCSKTACSRFMPDAQSGPGFRAIRVVPRRVYTLRLLNEAKGFLFSNTRRKA